MSLRETVTSLFKRFENLKAEFIKEKRELDQIAQKGIYTAKEIASQRQNFTDKYVTLGSNLVIEMTGSVKVGIDSDKIKVKLTESEIEKNAPWLSADVITFSSMNTTYSDEETFYMIQRYVGDFNTMIRFAKLPSFINSEKKHPVTTEILGLPYRFRNLETKICEAYSYSLDLIKNYFGNADTSLAIAVNEKSLMSLIDKFELLLEITTKAKKQSFEEIAHIDLPSV